MILGVLGYSLRIRPETGRPFVRRLLPLIDRFGYSRPEARWRGLRARYWTHGGHRSSPLLFSPRALLVRFEQQHEELVRQLLRRLVLLPQNLADLLLHLGIRLRSRGQRVVKVVCVVAMVKAHGRPRPCSPVHVA